MIKMMLLKTILLSAALFGGLIDSTALSQTLPEKQSPEQAWKKISPFFHPPEQWKNNLGTYRSVLKFDDGTPVKNAADWKKRRAELLKQWHNMLGPWPELNTKQRLEILETTKRENFTEHKIRLEWIPGQKTVGYILVPQSRKPMPAVITVYYEPETGIGKGNPHRDFAYQLAKRGFVTLSLGTSEATAARTYSLYYPSLENAKVQPLSMLACASANAWHALSHQKEVDKNRIGIVGHSFGGKWAMFSSCLFDKFACAAWSDPGIVFESDRSSINYWEPWYLGYHSKPWRKRGLITKENPAFGLYPRLIQQKRNLHELHVLMAPRPFLVSGGSEDPPRQWAALNHSVEVNRLLGYKNRVAMTNRPKHAPNAQSNEIIYSFFEHFLIHQPPDIKAE